MQNYTYPAKFEPDGADGILVTFPDLPEAITGGADEQEALRNAQEALELVVLTYVKQGRALPTPTKYPGTGGRSYGLSLPASTLAKMAFIEAFVEKGMTRVAFAAKLGKGENEVRRMLDPYHQTKLTALEAGLKALGKRLVIGVEEMA